MGRRAKKAPVVTKRRPKLSKRFKCPFCANDDVVECNMDFKLNIGSLSCRLCGASYQMTIHHLNEPIDVFSEWLDDCEAAAMNVAQQQSNHRGGTGGTTTGTSATGQYDDDIDDDDDLPNASGLQHRSSTKKSNTSNSKPSAKNDTNNRSIDLGVGDSEDDDDDDDE